MTLEYLNSKLSYLWFNNKHIQLTKWQMDPNSYTKVIILLLKVLHCDVIIWNRIPIIEAHPSSISFRHSLNNDDDDNDNNNNSVKIIPITTITTTNHHVAQVISCVAPAQKLLKLKLNQRSDAQGHWPISSGPVDYPPDVACTRWPNLLTGRFK